MHPSSGSDPFVFTFHRLVGSEQHEAVIRTHYSDDGFTAVLVPNCFSCLAGSIAELFDHFS